MLVVPILFSNAVNLVPASIPIKALTAWLFAVIAARSVAEINEWPSTLSTLPSNPVLNAPAVADARLYASVAFDSFEDTFPANAW
jgi:hypothetical protein